MFILYFDVSDDDDVMLINMMLMCIVYVDQGSTVTKHLLNDFPVPTPKLTNQLFSVVSAPSPWETMRFPPFFLFLLRKPEHIFTKWFFFM